MATTYGTGTALQFSDASQRQVLELGSKIHYYNPNVTPIFSLFGMKSNMTPVPIFEWMEDEYMIKKSMKFTTTASQLSDTATAGVNGDNAILICERQAQMEMFEVGGIYSASHSGSSFGETDTTHLLCIAVGKDVNHGSATDLMVQFICLHAHGSLDAYLCEEVPNSTDMIVANSSGVMTLEYVANAGRFYEAGSATNYYGYQTHSGTNGFGEINFDDDDYFLRENGVVGIAEGSAVGSETRKKVRRLKNCTQIFREPYTSSENPKRTFQGFDVGSTNGAVTSLNGASNTNVQWDVSSGLNNLDGVSEYVFQDMVSGSMKKTVFCSNKWLVNLASATRSDGTAFYDQGEKTDAGVRVRSYIGPVGELDFVPHPYLNGAYEDYAVAIDPANFSIRPLAGRDMQLRSDIVKDGRDGQTDEWLMEVGVEIRNEQTHAILKLV